MSDESKGLYQLGGAALIAGGILFFARDLLDHVAGPPPLNGAGILAWVASAEGSR